MPNAQRLPNSRTLDWTTQAEAPLILGRSRALLDALETAHTFAATPCHMLVVGETGTGKELFARVIHHWSGRPGPLVEADCGAIPAGLMESELFGHERGAFTGAVSSREGLVAASDMGTLFLDEIGSIAPAQQSVLLRALETRKVRRVGQVHLRSLDLRVIAATQPDAVLRPDLAYRLSGATIRLPPLRHRGDDVVHLARALVRRWSRELSSEAEALLRTHDWPGNVRELSGVVDRACHMADSVVIEAVTIRKALATGWMNPVRDTSGRDSTQDHAAIREVCRRCEWQAARIMEETGWPRSTMYRRLKAAGIRLRRRTNVHSAADEACPAP